GYCPSPGILGGAAGLCWEFDPAKHKWTRGPQLVPPPGGGPGGAIGAFIACWADKHSKFVIFSGGIACSFDPIAKTYSGWTGYLMSMGEGCGTYVSDLDEVWGCCSAGDSTAIWKLGFAPNSAPA